MHIFVEYKVFRMDFPTLVWSQSVGNFVLSHLFGFDVEFNAYNLGCAPQGFQKKNNIGKTYFEVPVLLFFFFSYFVFIFLF